jgi:hypothetical protein
MAKRPAKNITSLPSHTIVPTATVLGRVTEADIDAGFRVAVLTIPLCLKILFSVLHLALATLCK